MPKTEPELRQELARLIQLRDEASTAVLNVRELLQKADERRLKEGQRRWDQIIDNLERALDRTKSAFTTYQQQVKMLERQLEEFKQTGRITVEEFLPGIDEPIEIEIPKDAVHAAETVLSLPLEMLCNLTLDQVSEMHDRLFNETAPEPKSAAQQSTTKGQPQTIDSALAARIEHAKKLRESLAASHRTGTASFTERRRQALLRSGMSKAMKGDVKQLVLEEIEAIIECHKSLGAKDNPSSNDARLKGILDSMMDGLEAQAVILRRREVLKYKH